MAFAKYTVKKGESLTEIAKRCGCTVGDLAKLNGKSLKKMSLLYVGQRIKIPIRKQMP